MLRKLIFQRPTREHGTRDGKVGLTEGWRSYFIKKMFWGSVNASETMLIVNRGFSLTH